MARNTKAPANSIQVTQVALFNNSAQEVQTFDFAWAERILQRQEKYADKPFSLPEDGGYEFTGGKLVLTPRPPLPEGEEGE